MPVYTVYKSSDEIKYYSGVFSKAFFFQAVFISLYFIIPFIVAYRSQAFWNTQLEYSEKPLVTFDQGFVLMEFLTNTGATLRWGTLESYNSQFSSSLLVPSGQEILEIDTDQDGVVDSLELKFNSSGITTQIVHAKILLPFTLQFSGIYSLSVSNYVVVEHQGDIGGSSFMHVGDLGATQLSLLNSAGLTIQRPAITSNMADIIASVQSSQAQNADMRLSLINQFSVWNRRVDSSEYQFSVNIRINYVPILLRFKSPFWYSMKWAWVQYIFIALLFYGVTEWIRSFAFMNRVLKSFIRYPHLKCDRKSA